MCFKSNTVSAPAIQQAPAPPKETDKEIDDVVNKERELARRRKGKKSTILTSGMGLPDTNTGQQKQLLGQ